MKGETAQATVEMAVVVPVLVVLALIVYNLMVFASASVRFARVAPDVVIALGSSPAGEGGRDTVAGEIREALERAMEGYELEVEIVAERAGGGDGMGGVFELVGSCERYSCTMRLRPWPSSFAVAGVEARVPALLEYTTVVSIDPWRPGVVV